MLKSLVKSKVCGDKSFRVLCALPFWLRGRKKIDFPYNDFLLTVMSGLSQLERDLISQRTKEGLASAKAKGRNGGRPSKQNEKPEMVMALYDSGMKIADIMRNTELSRSTVNRIVKNYNSRAETIIA